MDRPQLWSAELITATAVASCALATLVTLHIFDARCFDLDGKRMPGPTSNLWGYNFFTVLIEARKKKMISVAMHEKLIPLAGDGNMLIVVAHPNMVKTVLTGNYVSFPKANMYNRFKFLLGNGLVTSEGDLWSKHRTLINPGFHSHALKSMVAIFNSQTLSMFQIWDARIKSNPKQSLKINLNEELSFLTMSIICEAAFGFQFDRNSPSSSALARDVYIGLDEINSRMMDPTDWWCALCFQRQRVVNESVGRLNQLTDDIIAKRIEDRLKCKQQNSTVTSSEINLSDTQVKSTAATAEAGGIDEQWTISSHGFESSEAGARPGADGASHGAVNSASSASSSAKTLAMRSKPSDAKDLLDLMIEASEGQGAQTKLSPSELRDHAFTFLGAGHETTASTLLWTLYELSQRPGELARCQEDIDRVLGGKNKTHVSYEDIGKFDYLTQVIKESLRLHPAVPTMAREPTEEVHLGDYRLASKGVVIITALMTLHRHPDFWSQPDEFIPGRFSKENVKQTLKHPFQYVPFSAGPRNCIGQRFAQMELAVVLALILSSYNVTIDPVDLKEVTFEETITYQPRNLQCVFTSRL